jgi:hypothetical protein
MERICLSWRRSCRALSELDKDIRSSRGGAPAKILLAILDTWKEYWGKDSAWWPRAPEAHDAHQRILEKAEIVEEITLHCIVSGRMSNSHNVLMASDRRLWPLNRNSSASHPNSRNFLMASDRTSWELNMRPCVHSTSWSSLATCILSGFSPRLVQESHCWAWMLWFNLFTGIENSYGNLDEKFDNFRISRWTG